VRTRPWAQLGNKAVSIDGSKGTRPWAKKLGREHFKWCHQDVSKLNQNHIKLC
jgi:hypothetical protein